MTVVRIRYVKRGRHYHCNLFTAPRDGATFALCGTLVFNEQEFFDIRGNYPEWDWFDLESTLADLKEEQETA